MSGMAQLLVLHVIILIGTGTLWYGFWFYAATYQ